jgi:hypothetical protein
MLPEYCSIQSIPWHGCLVASFSLFLTLALVLRCFGPMLFLTLLLLLLLRHIPPLQLLVLLPLRPLLQRAPPCMASSVPLPRALVLRVVRI